ncbi:MAG: ATP-dependent protease LonB [Candidatus Thermoplasmatota archaeon]
MKTEDLEPIEEWVKKLPLITTAEIDIPKKLVDQVIGQDNAVAVVKKAAEQKRHVLLIGEPGTGKSMIARAMSELLPKQELQDVIVYHNPDDPNVPKIKVVPAGKGKEIVKAQKTEALLRKKERSSAMSIIIMLIIVGAIFLSLVPPTEKNPNWSFNPMILFFGIIAAAMLWMATRYISFKQDIVHVPKLLISHEQNDKPPFIDATGAHAGALLGDVRHDPFQSGGLETPAHERVEAGAIHKANKGILFIDEINVLKIESQHSLLTSLQEREFSICGQSERSSGALVKTEPVPCDFVLVVAGNLEGVGHMHPALRSRIRGYGYEIYMKSVIEDTYENREKFVRFIAQEVANDKKIPHFDKSAIIAVLHEAQKRSGTTGHFSLRLRELGGLVRVAGDIAKEEGASVVSEGHVLSAKKIARPLEQQVADQLLEKKIQYKNFLTTGAEIGRVNGLAVVGMDTGMAELSGIVLPIVVEVTASRSSAEGNIIATGKLGEIAKEAVQNVSAIIKKYTGEDIRKHDIHIQFLGTYEGVEGDSASISVATAVISAYEGVEVRQDVAMTGSLSVRGQVLPVGGITPKIEAAAEAGIKKIIIPKQNLKDVIIEQKYKKMIEIVPTDDLIDVLSNALIGPSKEKLIQKLNAFTTSKIVDEKAQYSLG